MDAFMQQHRLGSSAHGLSDAQMRFWFDNSQLDAAGYRRVCAAWLEWVRVQRHGRSCFTALCVDEETGTVVLRTGKTLTKAVALNLAEGLRPACSPVPVPVGKEQLFVYIGQSVELIAELFGEARMDRAGLECDIKTFVLGGYAALRRIQVASPTAAAWGLYFKPSCKGEDRATELVGCVPRELVMATVCGNKRVFATNGEVPVAVPARKRALERPTQPSPLSPLSPLSVEPAAKRREQEPREQEPREQEPREQELREQELVQEQLREFVLAQEQLREFVLCEQEMRRELELLQEQVQAQERAYGLRQQKLRELERELELARALEQEQAQVFSLEQQMEELEAKMASVRRGYSEIRLAA
jgi:hypothetical protein